MTARDNLREAQDVLIQNRMNDALIERTKSLTNEVLRLNNIEEHLIS